MNLLFVVFVLRVRAEALHEKGYDKHKYLIEVQVLSSVRWLKKVAEHCSEQQVSILKTNLYEIL